MTNNILAIDYGRERVGLALARHGSPQRLMTLSHDGHLIAGLATEIQKQGVGIVVLGLPRTSDGNDTAWTAEVREFEKQLTKAISIPLVLQDEFATTEEAKARLASQKYSPKQQKELLDQESAVILLEDYIHAL